MMRLSTMWSVDRAIDGEGHSPILDRIVERWPHDDGSERFFRSSANFIATFRRDGQRHFLRFAELSERDRETIQAELDLVMWLASEGLDVSIPQPSLEGAFLETVEVECQSFHAVAFSACPGVRLESDGLDDAGFRRWGTR